MFFSGHQICLLFDAEIRKNQRIHGRSFIRPTEVTIETSSIIYQKKFEIIYPIQLIQLESQKNNLRDSDIALMLFY